MQKVAGDPLDEYCDENPEADECRWDTAPSACCLFLTAGSAAARHLTPQLPPYKPRLCRIYED